MSRKVRLSRYSVPQLGRTTACDFLWSFIVAATKTSIIGHIESSQHGTLSASRCEDTVYPQQGRRGCSRRRRRSMRGTPLTYVYDRCTYGRECISSLSSRSCATRSRAAFHLATSRQASPETRGRAASRTSSVLFYRALSFISTGQRCRHPYHTYDQLCPVQLHRPWRPPSSLSISRRLEGYFIHPNSRGVHRFVWYAPGKAPWIDVGGALGDRHRAYPLLRHMPVTWKFWHVECVSLDATHRRTVGPCVTS
ncbi:hypothetical protein K466DRAFT_76004 [Polyporus arcularius HHB13444]|uniref:Uncharacterized protein n=1 Tax=Polyporus arcularius HHB13444 TaxID=1314778 RepID=A0A5C3PFF6_9APHY|nr:hypothetical protein K466DRAFT_76004 [Polyporus arcularius HHB13444]